MELDVLNLKTLFFKVYFSVHFQFPVRYVFISIVAPRAPLELIFVKRIYLLSTSTLCLQDTAASKWSEIRFYYPSFALKETSNSHVAFTASGILSASHQLHVSYFPLFISLVCLGQGGKGYNL